jgi:hypothetical protein
MATFNTPSRWILWVPLRSREARLGRSSAVDRAVLTGTSLPLASPAQQRKMAVVRHSQEIIGDQLGQDARAHGGWHAEEPCRLLDRQSQARHFAKLAMDAMQQRAT